MASRERLEQGEDEEQAKRAARRELGKCGIGERGHAGRLGMEMLCSETLLLTRATD
jgi:hypothetical protein